MVFVFATITIGNANNNKGSIDCDQVAMDFFNEATDQGMSYEEANDLADQVQGSCEALVLLSENL